MSYDQTLKNNNYRIQYAYGQKKPVPKRLQDKPIGMLISMQPDTSMKEKPLDRSHPNDYTTSNNDLTKSNELNQLKYRIDKTANDPWVTESHDNYRNYTNCLLGEPPVPVRKQPKKKHVVSRPYPIFNRQNVEEMRRLQNQKRQQKELWKFKKESRYQPDTAFQRYMGKPAFAQYGVGNVNPSTGGYNYGEYMMSHNINPHRSSNNPQHPQVYEPVEAAYDQKINQTKSFNNNINQQNELFRQRVEAQERQRQRDLQTQLQLYPKQRKSPSKKMTPSIINRNEQLVNRRYNQNRLPDENKLTKRVTRPQTVNNINSRKQPLPRNAYVGGGNNTARRMQLRQARKSQKSKKRREKNWGKNKEPSAQQRMRSRKSYDQKRRQKQQQQPEMQTPTKQRESDEIAQLRAEIAELKQQVMILSAQKEQQEEEEPVIDQPEEEENQSESENEDDQNNVEQPPQNNQTVQMQNGQIQPAQYLEDDLVKQIVLNKAELPPEDKLRTFKVSPAKKSVYDYQVQELNPKSYQHVPQNWTERILPAGKMSRGRVFKKPRFLYQ